MKYSHDPGTSHLSRARFFALILFLLVSAPLLACWQTDNPPLKLNNGTVKAKFTYNGKPVPNAIVTLWSKKKGLIARKKLEENGWVFFPGIDPGEYGLTMDGPSHERFDIILSPAFPLRTVATVDFYDDYCHRTNVMPDPY